MAKPTYFDDGELLDSGYDMTAGGVCGYAYMLLLDSYLHDVIYITCFVLLMSIISGKFWWTYAVIPAFGAYKVLGLLKGILSECSKNCLMEKEVEVSPIQSQAVEAAGNKTEALC
ncbi:uncharacterized protein [Elaeis guineensis]|uniref:Transmembrane protein 208 homolog isoform X1 n=1 Tax=Elaeis guineensis var. tenera TaxID=51953 RepID=A0A8N4IDD1_ELAGV|nr:transmembrane protein 208 homolog isoform X1 [Elaeis guineensis]